ncbi:MAG: CinA family protein [Clostridia bacterium]|nr:CinA family protein [Clostridia bacterium]
MLEFSRTCPPLIVLRGAREDQIPQFLLVELCKKEGLTVSTAESCTAGLVSSKIADVPGASSVLCGGAVTYMSRIKHEWLGVSDKTIRSPGVYSELCAREMAEGVAEKSGSDLAVSVTGLAGPGGGTPEIPVGTVCFGYRIGKNTETETVHFPPDSSRETIRRESASHALLSLFKRILLRMEPETFFE